jgi:hypothetical protein
MGGTIGSILTPVFANSLVNPNIQSGALHGNWRLLGITTLSVVVLIPWLLLSTLLCLFLTNCFFKLRVTSELAWAQWHPHHVINNTCRRASSIRLILPHVAPCSIITHHM